MKEFLLGLFLFLVILILIFIWCACKICSEASRVEEQMEADEDGKTL